MEISKNGFLIDYGMERESRSMLREHFHRAYEIYYQLSGKRNYFIEDSVYPVKAGDLVLIDVYNIHRTTSSSTPKYSRIVLNFSQEFIGNHVEKGLEPELLYCFTHQINLLSLDASQQAYVSALMKRMFEESVSQKVGYDVLVRQLLIELLLFIRRNVAGQAPENPVSKSGLHREISLATHYISQHYMQPLSLENIAEMCHVSYYYFCRMFKEVTGFTLTEYIAGVRIRKSQALLKSANLSVTDIAQKTGFESTANFERVFKKVTGTSPLKFKKASSGLQ